MFNKMSEYNPIVAQGFIYGVELSGEINETTLICFDKSIWEMFLGESIHEKMNEFSSYQTMNFTVTTLFMDEVCISVCSEYDEKIECIVC